MNGNGEDDTQYAQDTIRARPDIARIPGVQQAQHDLSWAQTFTSTPPTEVLRARNNLVSLVGQAVDNKMRLQAQTDLKAADLYFKTKEFNEWQAQAPQRDALMQARINAEGATARFNQQQDELTMKHISGFADYMTNAPQIGTRDYHNYTLQGLKQFPLVATTGWGKQVLNDLGPTQDMAAQLQDIPEVPSVPKDYGLNLAQIQNPASVRVGQWKVENPGTDTERRTFEGKSSGGIVEIDTGKTTAGGKPIKSYLPIAEYTRFGGKLAPTEQTAQQNVPAGTTAPATGVSTPYQVGKRYGNLRFKGGDPNQEASWDVLK